MSKKHRSKRQRLRAPKNNPIHRELWKIIDGAIDDTFTTHPEYLTAAAGKRGRIARLSLLKRIAGTLTSFIEQSMRGRAQGAPATSGE